MKDEFTVDIESLDGDSIVAESENIRATIEGPKKTVLKLLDAGCKALEAQIVNANYEDPEGETHEVDLEDLRSDS